MTIERAAIRRDGTTYSVPRPGRHHDVIRYMVDVCGIEPPIDDEQGFITSHKQFLDREEAAAHALECGQIERLNRPPSLFSEDLW